MQKYFLPVHKPAHEVQWLIWRSKGGDIDATPEGGFEGGTSKMQQALAASCGGRVEWWEDRTADGAI